MSEIEIKWDNYFIFYNLIDKKPGDGKNIQILKIIFTKGNIVGQKYYIFDTQVLGKGGVAIVKLAIGIPNILK